MGQNSNVISTFLPICFPYGKFQNSLYNLVLILFSKEFFSIAGTPADIDIFVLIDNLNERLTDK
jgi:hypothetical protein